METRHLLQGIELRYALMMYLLQHGHTTVDELIKALEWQGFEIRRTGIETSVGCAALGAAARQGSSAWAWTLRPRVCTARHGVPDLYSGDGLAGRGEAPVVPRCPAI